MRVGFTLALLRPFVALGGIILTVVLAHSARLSAMPLHPFLARFALALVLPFLTLLVFVDAVVVAPLAGPRAGLAHKRLVGAAIATLGPPYALFRILHSSMQSVQKWHPFRQCSRMKSGLVSQ